MDDVCAISTSFSSHLERLEQIFQTLRNTDYIHINGKKCKFVMSEVTFCGFHVSEEGISPDDEKTSAIAKISTSSSTKEVRILLVHDTCMIGFYHRHIQHYATIAKLLSSLLEGDRKFQWSPECKNGFRTLKH